MLKMMNKRGELLVENVIFIILNLAFLSIIVLFLVQQSSSVSELEEVYAKKAALMIDSSKPAMKLKFDMREGLKETEDSGTDFEDVLRVEDNKVVVSLSNKTSHSYHFFNEVNVSSYPERNEQNEYTGLYVLTVNER